MCEAKPTWWAATAFTLLAALLTPSTALFAEGKDLKIAMILWRGETKAEQGFMDGLKELGYAVNYTTLNAEQDKTKLGYILREDLGPKLREFDYVYTFGTTVTKTTKTFLQDQVPHIFNAVADPVGAGIVDSLESSGSNIGGATIGISLALQVETAIKVLQFKRLGLIFNSREKNSLLIRDQLYEIAQKLRFEMIDLRSPPVQDMLQQHLDKLKDKSVVVDAVYLPQDSFLVSNAQLIGTELRAAKVKSIGSLKTYIDNGALMGVVPDYYESGKAVATIVDRHQKGNKLQNMPIVTQKNPTLVINKTTRQALNVEIPKDMLAKAVIVE